MIYLTKHSTQAAYDAVKDNLAKPQVALTIDNNKVHYMPNSITPTPDGHLYAKAFDEYETIGICDSLGKFVWFDVNGNVGILATSYTPQEVVQGNASYYLAEDVGLSVDKLEPNSIASINDIQDVGGMTILGSLATNLGFSDEYEVVFDPKETLLTE